MKYFKYENRTLRLVGEVSIENAQKRGLQVVEAGRGRLVAIEAPMATTISDIKNAILALDNGSSSDPSEDDTVRLSEGTKEDVQARLEKIHDNRRVRDRLRAGFAKLVPDASDAGLDIAVSGKFPSEEKEKKWTL